MRKYLSLILILSLTSLNSSALNFGQFSCGQIVDFERNNQTDQMSAVSLWAAGYIEGRNRENKQFKFVRTDHLSIYLLLLKECRDSPLSDNYDVIEKIYDYAS